MRMTRPMERKLMRVRVRVWRSDPKTVRIWKRMWSFSRGWAFAVLSGSSGVMNCLLLRCVCKV